MIHLLTEFLRDMLEDPRAYFWAGDFDKLQNAEVSLERPRNNVSRDTVSLFLYNIQENVTLRDNETRRTQSNDGRIKLSYAPLRVDCDYLVTCMAAGAVAEHGDAKALREHQMLGEALQFLSSFPMLPLDELPEELQALQEVDLPVVTVHPSTLQNASEFWNSIDAHYRPSLTLTVTLALPNPKTMDLGWPVHAKKVVTGLRDPETVTDFLPETTVERFRIHGQVTLTDDRQPVAGVVVRLTHFERRIKRDTITDKKGNFSFGNLEEGDYNLHIPFAGPSKDKFIVVADNHKQSFDIQL